MARKTAIGIQDFEKIIQRHCFYVDKTMFIKEWWESGDDVTLITRPRRFGKTLTMSMLDYFFSVEHKKDSALFNGLSIWQDDAYQKLQGTYPVIFLSFASVKESNFKDTKKYICMLITQLYQKYRFLLNEGFLDGSDAAYFNAITPNMDHIDAKSSLNQLSNFLSRYYGKKVLILLDEYDTPMQEAYLNGYWDEMAEFIRGLFNATFKTNPYLEKAILTGITRVSKESVFSDLNNLKVITTLSNQYATTFGFTEKEVFDALTEFGLQEQMHKVKYWYDGFRFGMCNSIYNPWSIINFLDQKELAPYWVNTSSNALVSDLIRNGANDIKKITEDLLQKKTFKTTIDEEIVFNRLDVEKNAVWSLLLASGYLKVVNTKINVSQKKEYELAITNFEVHQMFRELITGWFNTREHYLSEFCNALVSGDLKAINTILNDILLKIVSYFDTGTEAFYHGLTLGLIACMGHQYTVLSNYETGFGRCDTVLEPKDKCGIGLVLEYKLFNPSRDKDLKDTASRALSQVVEKKYSAGLEARDIPKDRIKIYGFAFSGKKVFIDGGSLDDLTSSSLITRV